MPIFGDPTAAMNGGVPGMGPEQQAGGPVVPQGARSTPDAASASLANQLYQTQQMLIQLQQEVQDLKNKKRDLEISLHRDTDGQLVGMTATEGAN